jgi:hypothetical protein
MLAACWVVALGGCRRDADQVVGGAQEVGERPGVVSGNSLDFGISIKNVLLKRTSASVDARFEVGNQGRSIVKVQVGPGRPEAEAVLSVEVFRHGRWDRILSTADQSPHFEDLWPGATEYARATLPADARWVRVIVHAKELVGKKDNVTVVGPTEVFSDAIEVPGSE